MGTGGGSHTTLFVSLHAASLVLPWRTPREAEGWFLTCLPLGCTGQGWPQCRSGAVSPRFLPGYSGIWFCSTWQCLVWVHPSMGILSRRPDTSLGLTSDDQSMVKQRLYPKQTGGNRGSCLLLELNWFRVTMRSCFSPGACLRVGSSDRSM